MTDETTPESSRRAAPSAAPQKRELEEAPQLVRKAAVVLLIGALFPWLTAIATNGKMPWGHWAGGIALTLLAGGILIEAAKANAGLKANGLVKSIAGAHPLAGTGAALVVFIGAIVVAFMGNSLWIKDPATFFGFDPSAEGVPEAAGDTYSLYAVMELGTLLLALATLAHVLAYEYGHKFNPIFPLMFLGPAVAGILKALGSFAKFGDHPLVPLAVIGSLLVGAGGIMAMYTMYVSMKAAKVEGERKAALKREARKQERASRRRS